MDGTMNRVPIPWFWCSRPQIPTIRYHRHLSHGAVSLWVSYSVRVCSSVCHSMDVRGQRAGLAAPAFTQGAILLSVF